MWHGARLEYMGSWVQFLLQSKGEPNGQTAEVPGMGDFQKLSQTNINISEGIIFYINSNPKQRHKIQ